MKRSDLTPEQKPTNSAPTLVHVARLAGVGLGTASRALSGQGYVHHETLQRIQEAVHRLGYRRNEVARSLRVRQSYAVGIIIPDIGGPFMIDVVRAAQSVLRERGYMSVIAFTNGNSETEREEIEYLMGRQIDGLLVVPADSAGAHLTTPRFSAMPVVFFDQPLADKNFDAILVKNRQSARLAAEHLIEHGHKRIACVGMNRHLYTSKRRVEGYRDAIRAAGLQEYLELVEPDEVDAKVGEWLAMKAPPTAIFSLNELCSLKVIEALASRQIHMPDQVAFIGFDEVQLGRYLNPPLTAVVQPSSQIGEKAALRLLERIDAKEPIQARHTLLDTTFIRRGSCGCNVDLVPG